MSLPLAEIVLALAAINLATFALIGLDKALARRGAQRIREATLLWLALLGGTPGAYAARRLFRHKTRKQPFSSRLFAIAVIQSTVMAGWIGWRWAG